MFRRTMTRLRIIFTETLRDKNREPFSHEAPVGETFKKKEAVSFECKATL
jgi:hypothetical protein